MKANRIKIILLILLLGTFVMIFKFSNQNGEKSGNISRTITDIVTKNAKVIQTLEQKEKEKVLKQIENIIRKMAHFLIYKIVGLLLMGVMSIYPLTNKKRISISITIGTIYASLDEIHQAFIPERTARVTDVMIDTLGVILGILCVLAIKKLIQKREENKVT